MLVNAAGVSPSQASIETILKVDFRITESEDNLKRGLQSLFLSKTGNLISRHSLMKALDQFVDECIRIELNKEKPDRTRSWIKSFEDICRQISGIDHCGKQLL